MLKQCLKFGRTKKSIMVFLKVVYSPLVVSFVHESHNEKHCHLTQSVLSVTVFTPLILRMRDQALRL